MDEALGWTVYLSISAAVAFYVAGYVTRVALGATTSNGAACSGSCCDLPAEREKACLPGETCGALERAGEVEVLPAAEGGYATAGNPMEELPGRATEGAAGPALRDSETSSAWPPEREVSQPPLSCPPPSCPPRPVLRSGLFLAERKTLPFHRTISERSARVEQAGPSGQDDGRWAPEATRPSWSSDDAEAGTGGRAELLRLRRALRRLAQRQRELEARVESALERLGPTPESFTGTAREGSIGTLLEDLPRDIEAAVVTGALGIPMQQAGPSRLSAELAGSLGPIKRMANEVAEIAAFPSRPRRIQVEDLQGVRLDCWLLDPNEDLYSVVLLRLPGPPDELEAPMKRIAAELGLSDTPAYGHPVRTSSAS